MTRSLPTTASRSILLLVTLLFLQSCEQTSLAPETSGSDGTAVQRIIEAVCADDISSVERFIEAGHDLSRIYEFPDEMRLLPATPLHLAAILGRHEIATLLVGHVGDIDTASSGGYTALHSACTSCDQPMIALLLGSGADVTARTDDGLSCLHLVGHCDVSTVAAVMDTITAHPVLDNKGQTALHHVARRGRLANARFLIESGYDPNARDSYGKSPLLHAVAAERIAMARLLLDQGADPNLPALNHESALMQAASIDSCLVSVLLKSGADPNQQDNSGHAALHHMAFSLAYERHQFGYEIVSVLHRHGADLSLADNLGRTPLHLAMQWVNAVAVDALLHDGGDMLLQIEDNVGLTPIEYLHKHNSGCNHRPERRVRLYAIRDMIHARMKD